MVTFHLVLTLSEWLALPDCCDSVFFVGSPEMIAIRCPTKGRRVRSLFQKANNLTSDKDFRKVSRRPDKSARQA
jgi:hypothetical protein